ncbi:uncharacterized protein LOC124595663 [Schistocerca americana]|uniref:uncharacterized protein LOC124595663 n=1 Tax=Schistocerca americana TaxID=7009 RepID=UPI001F4FA589|nr:uncharacterized protein LOC124595663 [Schistocerca americana]
MKCFTLLLLLISSCAVFARNIPSNLIDCYTNQTLMERDNRLPATLTTLIDIIRKLELLHNSDVRVLSTALLNTFRVDGITFNPEIQPSNGVSPYGIQGFQKEKHALLMKSFLPENTESIDVTILTPFEKCALHFMLSDSIEFHKRGSESTDCSNMQSYRQRRIRRDITAAAAANEFASNDTAKQATPSDTSGEIKPPQEKAVEKESVDKMDFPFPITVINVTTAEENTPLSKSDTEPPKTETTGQASGDQEPPVIVSQSSEVKSSKAELEESLTDIEEPVAEVKEPVLDVKEPQAKSMQSAKLTLGKITVVEPSQCPVENGVIYDKWGSLSAANLIAGIATGIQTMENVKFNDIYPDSANANTTSLVMDNRWAATLAGDLAEVVIHQGPKSEAIKIGTPGGWNDSVIPHWYFINRAEQTQMTDAEIRGGLDGLIIAKNIVSWRSQKPNLRLSHILQQYYSEKGVLNTPYKACSRREQYAAVTPETEMKAQVDAFAYTLYTSAPLATSMKLEAVKSFSADAISALNSYITSLDSTSCSTTTQNSGTNTSVATEVDLYVVIDSSWQFTDIQRILVSIAEMINLNSIRGSRISVFTGNSFKPWNGTMSFIEFYQNFNQSSYVRVGDTGFQLRTLLETHIKSFFQNMFDEWKETGSAGGPAPVVLFVPNGAVSISDSDLNAAQQAVNNFWNNMPDVAFRYMVTSGADRVQSLVLSQEDVITYTMPTTRTEKLDLNALDTSLKKVHKRITNSICSYNKNTQSYSSAEFVDYVQLGYISYYKVNSKYLFGASSVRIKVQNVQYGTVEVCYSRRIEFPMNNTQTNGNDVTCITGQGGDKEISLSSPCNGYEKILYCPPLYIAILGQQSTGSECTVKGCVDVTDIQMKISHQGLTCGVSQILGNKMLITVMFLVLLRSILNR